MLSNMLTKFGHKWHLSAQTILLSTNVNRVTIARILFHDWVYVSFLLGIISWGVMQWKSKKHMLFSISKITRTLYKGLQVQKYRKCVTLSTFSKKAKKKSIQLIGLVQFPSFWFVLDYLLDMYIRLFKLFIQSIQAYQKSWIKYRLSV